MIPSLYWLHEIRRALSSGRDKNKTDTSLGDINWTLVVVMGTAAAAAAVQS